MQTLMAAVLLRLCRRDALGPQPALIARTENRDRPPAPVEANGGPLSERSATGRPCSRKAASRIGQTWSIGARHRLAAQKVAAVRIRQGQGLAPRPVAGPEPALEIDAPHVVGRSARGKRRRARRHAPAQPALHRQTLAIAPDRARRRPSSASRRCSQARTFTGPQLGCVRRTDRHASAISSHSDRARRCDASESPETPSSR